MNVKTFHKIMLCAVTLAALVGIFAMPILLAADAPPTPLTSDEVSIAAEAAILVQSAQIQAMQAQQRFQEAGDRYRAIVEQLRGKHDARPGCNLTAAQKWSCPPATKEESNAAEPPKGSDGSGSTGK